MRKRPVEFSGFGIDRAEWQGRVADPGYRNDLGVISSRENLIRCFEVRGK